jgi:hypothetical protein
LLEIITSSKTCHPPPAVEKITGRRPIDVQQFARDYAPAFAG